MRAGLQLAFLAVPLYALWHAMLLYPGYVIAACLGAMVGIGLGWWARGGGGAGGA